MTVPQDPAPVVDLDEIRRLCEGARVSSEATVEEHNSACLVVYTHAPALESACREFVEAWDAADFNHAQFGETVTMRVSDFGRLCALRRRFR